MKIQQVIYFYLNKIIKKLHNKTNNQDCVILCAHELKKIHTDKVLRAASTKTTGKWSTIC